MSFSRHSRVIHVSFTCHLHLIYLSFTCHSRHSRATLTRINSWITLRHPFQCSLDKKRKDHDPSWCFQFIFNRSKYNKFNRNRAKVRLSSAIFFYRFIHRFYQRKKSFSTIGIRRRIKLQSYSSSSSLVYPPVRLNESCQKWYPSSSPFFLIFLLFLRPLFLFFLFLLLPFL